MNPLVPVALSFTLSLAALAASAMPAWESLPVPQPLPPLAQQGRVDHAGASIWYGVVGTGAPVILLHGGRGSSLMWGNQVAALVDGRRQVILLDSRGQGRSTLGDAPLSYELMKSDVVAVMDALGLAKADIVGWSDGANVGVAMAISDPARIGKLFAFGANVNDRHLTPPAASPLYAMVGQRLKDDYASLGGTPAGFEKMGAAVGAMQKTAAGYSDAQLSTIKGPKIAVVGADHDEFISQRHTKYAADTIPGARYIMLRDVSHFAPWQDPHGFNTALMNFLND